MDAPVYPGRGITFDVCGHCIGSWADEYEGVQRTHYHVLCSFDLFYAISFNVAGVVGSDRRVCGFSGSLASGTTRI